MDVNIFTRVGFVVLVGLASKNAILIVEFAKQQRLAGVSRREATMEACRLRLRPIVMTSFAFILGVVPLIVSHGAGAEMRQALGMAVFSGMIGVTLFGLALTPVFFYGIDWLGESRLFATKGLRMVSGFLLAALSLRPVRRLGFEAAMRVAAAARRKPKKIANSTGKSAINSVSPTVAPAAPLADETLVMADETAQSPSPIAAPHVAVRGASRPEFVSQPK